MKYASGTYFFKYKISLCFLKYDYSNDYTIYSNDYTIYSNDYTIYSIYSKVNSKVNIKSFKRYYTLLL